ncbi:hypothetical protein PybrP1_001775 [[Pythium] brassicae (nom. inval.)]|nr:hypothetical protein PybrP1_001775 [[Pythium] brassicae (nom. inval.)]
MELQHEVERLREDAARWKRELKHVQEEKSEIEEAFRRLDRETASEYNLAERKEKELKIAELITKNQKLLEKELRTQSELRASMAQLQAQNQSQAEQIALMNSVMAALETKHGALGEVHTTTKINLEAAQLAVEMLQESVNDIQQRLVSSGNQQQRFAEYEHKIQSWERKYLDLDRKFTDRNHRAQVLAQEVESLVENKAALESELARAHDQVIRSNALMKTMQARIEAGLQSEQTQSSVDRVSARADDGAAGCAC